MRILTADKGDQGQYSGNALPPSSFANIAYGNNLYYADNLDIANQIYPVESGTGNPGTDIPNFTTLGITLTSTFPMSKTTVVAYDGTKAVKAAGTDPLFVKFTLAGSTGKPADISYATGFDFNLQSGSPAIGKGVTTFGANYPFLSVVPISDNFGSSGITPPNKDLGAYPIDGSGNKH